MLNVSILCTRQADLLGSCKAEESLPELAVMPLVSPPEGVLPQNLVLLEVCAHPPALVICQGVPILLEQGVDPGNATIP